MDLLNGNPKAGNPKNVVGIYLPGSLYSCYTDSLHLTRFKGLPRNRGWEAVIIASESLTSVH